MTFHDLIDSAFMQSRGDLPLFRKPVVIEEADGTKRPVRRVRVGRHAIYLIPENDQ